MMKDNCILISVESRKGGVGKTTAALNLARILLEKKEYAVLFLDVDITGTNATDILDSPFWSNVCHTVRNGMIGKEPKRANLLEIFDRRFMAGLGVPVFFRSDNNKSVNVDSYLTFETNKVNVIGSQIYGYDNSNSDGSKEKNIICEPSILFDELHAFWFVEFLQEICTNFVNRIKEYNLNATIAIIIDNSPGYVGISPAIQDWLTDLGPGKGKYLTISSLDKQDLLACSYAIYNLHRLFIEKWNASRQFVQAINQVKDNIKEPNLKVSEESFFLRLIESTNPNNIMIKSEDRTVDLADARLSFYKNDNSKEGEAYINYPEKYQALLINRIPSYLNNGIYSNNVTNMILSTYRKVSELLSVQYGYNVHDLTSWMVGYDEYIDNQFNLPLIFNENDWMSSDMRRFREEIVKFIKERHFPSIYDDFQTLFYEGKTLHPETLNEVKKQIQNLHESVYEMIHLIEQAGYRNLTRLIHNEWLPGNILVDFRTNIQALKLRIGIPFPEYEVLGIDKDPVSPMIIDFLNKIENTAKKLSSETNFPFSFDIFRQFLASLSIVLALSSTYLWRGLIMDEFSQLFGMFIFIEANHWKHKNNLSGQNQSLQQFLANDKISDNENNDLINKIMRNNDFGNQQLFTFIQQLYDKCSSAQARVIDIKQDAVFLMDVMTRLFNEKDSKLSMIPYIKDIIEKVIVDKTISHNDGRKQISKGFSSANFMADFSKVLEMILEGWE